MYKIDRENLKAEKKFYRVPYITGIGLFVFCVFTIIATCIASRKISIVPIIMGIFFYFFTRIFVNIGKEGMENVDEKNERYDYLETHGKLIRGLNYKLKSTGIRIRGRRLSKLVSEYVADNGERIELFGNPIFNGKYPEDNGTVELLIDPDNIENYCLDIKFEEVYDTTNNFKNSPIG